MEKFLSCDWGTTSFRLRLVELAGSRIIAEENSDQGIAKVFQLWRQSEQGEDTRFSFYRNVVSRHIDALKKKLNSTLDGYPLVVSGMACSTLGMIDLPYKEAVFSTDGTDLVTQLVAADNNFNHDIIFISGCKTDSDAMRGEETQLVGCFPGDQEQLFIFPGTHSKHVTVKNRKAINIKTYMTGEFFELLSVKSILAASIEKSKGVSEEENARAFETGVKESLRENILHSSFKVRTNFLFHKLTQPENYHYLSGLLIGTEIKEIAGIDHDIILVSDSLLRSGYEAACKLVMHKSRRLTIKGADEAMARGQIKILERLLKEKRLPDAL